MRIPDDLTKSISARASRPGIAKAAQELSDTYRARDFAAPALKTPEQRLAYLLVRMPATFAACANVLQRVAETVEDFALEGLLDLGAGPGTASWVAADVFSSLRTVQLMERDAAMIELGRELMKEASHPALREAKWSQADLSREIPAQPADLVMLSYVLGELPVATADGIVQRAWELTNKVLVIVEPGTKVGFAQVERIRAMMIAAGAEIAAPCPHRETCPMKVAGDWCHFSQRLERSSEHRRMKGGDLGYEDEKFSYVAFTKIGARRPSTRIVRHPLYRPKQVQLTLCTADGLKQTTVTKSQGDRYRTAKKAEWGDGFE